VLRKHHPLYINTHFNHPAELTPQAVQALGRLADAGIPLGCQTVLLRGINDDPEIMRELMERLLTARVRPYYLYMCDNVAGVEHFKTNVEKGLETVRALRGWVSGLAVPHFVIDAPGGGGKIPLLPEYVEEISEDEVVLRNYQGDRYVWTQPRREVLVTADVNEPSYDLLSFESGRQKRAKRSSRRKKTTEKRRRA
jgi:lysine 2,3-aminomutase